MAPFFPKTNSNSFGDFLCPKCVNILSPYKGYRCSLCGIPLGLESGHSGLGDAKGGKLLCPDCSRNPPLWKTTAYHGLYGGPLRDICLRLKFDGHLYLSRLLANFLLETSQCLPKPDVLMAIPQHPDHLCKRGYNQAQELAAMLAKLGGLVLENNILERIRQGNIQEGLTAAQRRANLRGAFKAQNSANGLKIWLVDDVMTTGSTFTEACSALLTAGAKEIYALFVARTPLP